MTSLIKPLTARTQVSPCDRNFNSILRRNIQKHLIPTSVSHMSRYTKLPKETMSGKTTKKKMAYKLRVIMKKKENNQ